MKKFYLFILAAAALSAAPAVNAQHFPGEDVTSQYVTNPSFDNATMDGWTSVDFGIQTNSEMHGPYAECWRWSASAMNGAASIGQTINIPAGSYELSSYMVARGVKGRMVVKSGDEVLVSIIYTPFVKETKTVAFTIFEDKEVTFSYGKGGDDNGNDAWLACDDWKLVFVNSIDGLKADILATAEEVYTQVQDQDAKDALSIAIDGLNEAVSETEFNTAMAALQDAIDAAKTQIIYESASVDNPQVLPISFQWTNGIGAQNFGNFTTPYNGVAGPEYEGRYQESWNPSAKAGKIFTQTLTNMPAGVYKFTACVFANTNDAVCAFAADQTSDKLQTSSESNAKYMSVYAQIEAGALEYGVMQEEALCNWAAVADPSLTYYGDVELHDVVGGAGDGIEAVSVNRADDVIYDLQGRKVQHPTSGLYIVNGKKVVF